MPAHHRCEFEGELRVPAGVYKVQVKKRELRLAFRSKA